MGQDNTWVGLIRHQVCDFMQIGDQKGICIQVAIYGYAVLTGPRTEPIISIFRAPTSGNFEVELVLVPKVIGIVNSIVGQMAFQQVIKIAFRHVHFISGMKPPDIIKKGL